MQTELNGKTPSQMGRPPKKPADRRSERVVLMVTEAEAEKLDKYAEDKGFDGRTSLLRRLLRDVLED